MLFWGHPHHAYIRVFIVVWPPWWVTYTDPIVYILKIKYLLCGRAQLWCWWSSSVSLVLNQWPPPGMLVNNKYCPMLSQHCPDLIALLEIVSIVTMHVINIVMRNFNCYRNLYLWDTLFTWSSYVTFLWSSGEGQARIGKGWPLRQKASKLKPEPRAYTKVGCHPPTTTTGSLITLD